MTIDPESDEYNYHDGYWRCGRGDMCALKAGWGTDHVGVGACKLHGGNAGAPEGNDNAVDVAAWAEDFYADFLTEAEKDRVMKSAEALGDEATAREQAAHAASVCLEQFRRTGDERFMRRYESIADTFGLAPADEVTVDADVAVSGDVSAEFVTYTPDDDDE